jgi:GTP-dependent phosphoenolpyruvate carboxykinase
MYLIDHVRCVGDDIAWMHVTPEGSLNAINPENGTVLNIKISRLFNNIIMYYRMAQF